MLNYNIYKKSIIKNGFFNNNYSSMFQNLEYRNSPTQPDMKHARDNANKR